MAFITMYAFSQIIIRVFIIQWVLGAIYREIDINVQPLHQDDAGGLVSIGNLIRTYTYWVLMAGLFIVGVGYTYYDQYGVVPYYTYIYLIILPVGTLVAFFLPMLSTHRAMLKCLERELAKLNSAYEVQIQTIWESNPTNLVSRLGSIDQLIATSSKIRKVYPTWPFNSRLLRRFGLSLLVSLLPLIYAVLGGVLINKLIP